MADPSIRELLAIVAEPDTPEQREEAWNKIEARMADRDRAVEALQDAAQVLAEASTYLDEAGMQVASVSAHRACKKALAVVHAVPEEPQYGEDIDGTEPSKAVPT